jgi:hypothetical protein
MKKFEIFNSENGQSQTLSCRPSSLAKKLVKVFGQGFWQPGKPSPDAPNYVGAFEADKDGILRQIYAV